MPPTRESRTLARVVSSGRLQSRSTPPTKGSSDRIKYQLHVNVQTVGQFGRYGRQRLRPPNRFHRLLVEHSLTRARSHPDAEKFTVPAYREMRIDFSFETLRTRGVRVTLVARDVAHERLLEFRSLAVLRSAHSR